MGDKLHGLYPKDRSKFIVRRRDGTDAAGGKHEGCPYFVLDLAHDAHAIPALRAYAASARKDGYETLATDLEQITDPAATTSPSETAVGGEAQKNRSNHFSDAAISKGFPDHISRDGTAHYSDGTVLPAPVPAAGADDSHWQDRARKALWDWKGVESLSMVEVDELVKRIAAALRSGKES